MTWVFMRPISIRRVCCGWHLLRTASMGFKRYQQTIRSQSKIIIVARQCPCTTYWMSPIATAAALTRLSWDETKKLINNVKHRNALGTCIHHILIVEREKVAFSGNFLSFDVRGNNNQLFNPFGQKVQRMTSRCVKSQKLLHGDD